MQIGLFTAKLEITGKDRLEKFKVAIARAEQFNKHSPGSPVTFNGMQLSLADAKQLAKISESVYQR